MSDLVKLTGLWMNTDKNGEKFMSGTLGSCKIMIMKNKFKKEGEKTPDYNIFIAPAEKKDDSANTAKKEEVPF